MFPDKSTVEYIKVDTAATPYWIELNDIWIRAFPGPMNLGLRQALCAPCSVVN